MATRLGKRPHPKNYAMYDARGKARYRKDLAEYHEKKKKIEAEKNKLSTKKNLDKQKTANKKAVSTTKAKTTTKSKVTPKATTTKAKSLATGKKTSTTKAVETPKVTTTTKRRTTTSKTKKPVTKKTTTKKTTTTKPAAKKPPARKPLISNKNKLRIKKGAKTAVDTTKKVVKRGRTFLKNQKAKLTAKDQTPQQANPAPKTKAQKLMSRINKSYQNYKGQVLDKAAKDFSKKGKLRSGLGDKSLKAQSRGGTKASLAAGALTLATNALVDRAFKPKNMTIAEYRAAKEKSNQEGVQKFKSRIKKTAGNLVNKVRGKSEESSTTSNIKKQKKSNNTGLKIRKTERSSNKNTNKDYNAKTATKKRNTKLSEFRADPKENRKLQLEAQNKKPITYSRELSSKAKNQVSDTKKKKKEKPKSKFIRTSKGTLARRGSVTARRAENKERARKRAQEMARRRLANK